MKWEPKIIRKKCQNPEFFWIQLLMALRLLNTFVASLVIPACCNACIWMPWTIRVGKRKPTTCIRDDFRWKSRKGQLVPKWDIRKKIKYFPYSFFFILMSHFFDDLDESLCFTLNDLLVSEMPCSLVSALTLAPFDEFGYFTKKCQSWWSLVWKSRNEVRSKLTLKWSICRCRAENSNLSQL